MEDLEYYTSLVDFLGKALGSRYEIVLHDLSTPEKSIIAIANGNVSGRKIGGPVTDFLLKILKKGKQDNVAFIANYKGKTGNKICRSSSYFIHNKKGKIMGVLCINVDITPLTELKNFVDKEISFNNDEHEKLLTSDILENLEGTVDDLIQNMITTRMEPYISMGNRISSDDRLQLVRNLYIDGFFLLRGSVNALAEKFNISEPTIYRYLNQVKRQIENNSHNKQDKSE